MKYILVFAVIAVAIWCWRRARHEALQERRDERHAARAETRAVAAPQAMVRCAHCGLHLPAAEAVRSGDGKAYCSTAHQRAGRSGET